MHDAHEAFCLNCEIQDPWDRIPGPRVGPICLYGKKKSDFIAKYQYTVKYLFNHILLYMNKNFIGKYISLA